MANHLDLEEQEQLDQLKHFWNQYGNLITWALIAVFGSVAGWNGWQYWQRNQSLQASTLYEEVSRAAQSGDAARLDRSFADIQGRFGGTVFAQQAGLLVGKTLFEKGNLDGAKSALSWVADKSSDPGYKALARLRLASVLVDSKSYDDALQQLSGKFPEEFQALVADRRGDIYLLQGKKAEAREAFSAAFKGLDERTEYRRLVEVKLNSLGVDPQPSKAATPEAGAKS